MTTDGEVLSQANTDLIPSRVALDRRALSRLPCLIPLSLLPRARIRADDRNRRRFRLFFLFSNFARQRARCLRKSPLRGRRKAGAAR